MTLDDPDDQQATANTPNRPAETTISPLGRALQKAYLVEILAGKRETALEMVIDAFHSGLPISAIYMEVFQEVLYEIGWLWETNQITVADDHMATAITQYVISNLYRLMEISDAHLGKVVMTGVQGELHQIGANMVADVLEADGWDVQFLGTNVPPEGIIQSIRRQETDILGISSTMFFNIPKVIQLVAAVREEFGERAPRIILGGGAFRMLPQLPGELAGCNVAHDLREVLDLARRGL